ncbi:helix-turn-helix transcriptional regulator [Streptacidiphilus sp. N1-3]|uniref:Helix-turn-helix transcriptional regulator n=1 Tax=Streptacidiphilus alkalitolerans TaxID=3342712 RepID=A0ABV6X7K8_9ACTN
MSDVVAEQVRKRREELGMTRDQLAERCASLGYPEITYAALTNIERRASSRRRDVTVDELMILGFALSIPPLLLAFPVGDIDKVPLPPRSNRISTHWAWKWAAGLEPPGMRNEGGGISVASGPTGGDNSRYRDSLDAWRAAVQPLQAYQELQAASDALAEAIRERDFARIGYGEESPEYRNANAGRLAAFRGVAEVLNRMMSEGRQVPAYTPTWAEELKALQILDHPESLPVLMPDGTVVRGGGETP